MKKILLANWTHRHNIVGGTESRYGYLKQVFPDAEMISYEDLFGQEQPRVVNKMDEYYLKRYKEDKNILIIRDAEVGGALDISKIPQIAIFGNPYRSLYDLFKLKYYNEWFLKPKNLEKVKKVAVSNFMKQDMFSINLTPDEIIPNPIDIDFFKPLDKEKLRKKYEIPKNKKVGMWVGSTGTQIKNFVMMSQMINIFKDEICWILVTKKEIEASNKAIKVFCDVNREVMRDLYNCADFYILTSPIEGCNNTIFEAMACNLPCIVAEAGYFWDFWDNRIGFKIQWNDLLVHIGAIKMIDKIKTNPRQVIIDRGLDLKTWGEKWKKLVKQL